MVSRMEIIELKHTGFFCWRLTQPNVKFCYYGSYLRLCSRDKAGEALGMLDWINVIVWTLTDIPVQSMKQIVTYRWFMDCQKDSNDRKWITALISISVERNNCLARLAFLWWDRCDGSHAVSSQCDPSAFLVWVWIVLMSAGPHKK
jgi:hypothetical protein